MLKIQAEILAGFTQSVHYFLSNTQFHKYLFTSSPEPLMKLTHTHTHTHTQPSNSSSKHSKNNS